MAVLLKSSSIAFLLILLVSVLCVVVYMIRNILNQKPIVVEDVKQESVMGIVSEIAQDLVGVEYGAKGKLIYQKNGKVRSDFVNEIKNKEEELCSILFRFGRFKTEFFSYVNHIESMNGPVKRSDLYSLMLGYINYRETDFGKKYVQFLGANTPLSPDDFFKIKERQQGDMVGVYVLYNKSKNKYYVGQTKRLFFRINQHFTGYGNGDIYADYVYGDQFAIQIIKLTDSGYSDIDKLEKDLIKKYDAYKVGYNKTSGNE